MNAARVVARAVFAFSRDLRLSDHAGLAAAARHGEVVAVHVVDPVSAARLRRSPRRAAYYCAAVAALDAALRARGSRADRAPREPRTGAARAGARGRRGRRRLELRLRRQERSAATATSSRRSKKRACARCRSTTRRPFRRKTRPRAITAATATAPSCRTTRAGGRCCRRTTPGRAAFAPVEIASEPLPVPEEFGSQASAGEAVGEDAARARS